MKIFLLTFLLSYLGGCKIGEQNAYGYVVKNSYMQGFKSSLKFYSYKNYLIEIINKSVSTINTKGSEKEILETEVLEYIYLIDINKSSISIYDSFVLNAKFKEKIMYNQKTGLKLDTADEITKRIYLTKQFKDTIVNNEKLKFYDTSYSFKNVNLKSYFFLQQKKFNTLFEVQNKDIQKKIAPFTFYGISAYSGNNEAVFVKIDSIIKLNKEEINIFEKIISDAEAREINGKQ